MDMAKVALCIIATNNYIDFVPPLIESADKYFLQGHEVTYEIFTNSKQFLPINIGNVSMTIYKYGNREIKCHPIKHEPWPAMTLKRYHIITGVDLSHYDYVYYIDADSRFVAPVGDEILADFVAVQHPGYYKGGGDWETRPQSRVFVHKHYREKYVCGGFQGGAKYWEAAHLLSHYIDRDTSIGIIPKWHDESAWNHFYAFNSDDFLTLSPSYCIVEEPVKRRAWGIDHLEPKIIALDKDHKKYQV